MAGTDFHYRWDWKFTSPPEALWPLVSNTDRFNRDCGFPSVTVLPPVTGSQAPLTNARRLQTIVAGVALEWEELAFEWLEPVRFSVDRVYRNGPFARLRTQCDLAPAPGGGTALCYQLWIKPAGLLGRLAIPYAIGRRSRTIIERVLRRYDAFAARGLRASQLAQAPRLADGGSGRLEAAGRVLVAQASQSEPLVQKLTTFVAAADDLAVMRMRPYALADQWGASRRETLQLCLHATRAGLLDFGWTLICPHCRGAQASQSTLTTLSGAGHCDSCQVDFTANFDQSVEVTFTPNPAIRTVPTVAYCVGGPQVTPHIVAQQILAPAESRTLSLSLNPGRYRVRAVREPAQQAFRVEPSAPAELNIALGASPLGEPSVAPAGRLTVANTTGAQQTVILEHVAWSDQSTTAAEVTSLQTFRDLFSREVLRRGESISVGSLTVVFTDLKNSTRLYKDIGDAPAFGRVLTHFEILKAAVAAEGGALVKTMGDAIMAVFPRPLPALRAMLRAQQHLARPQDFELPPEVSPQTSTPKPLALKAGLHCGPCLVINQNDRLDYFGTTVNFTARLCGLCTGTDLILSSALQADPEVAAHLAGLPETAHVCTETTSLKGFGDEAFEIWRVSAP
ncbi:MAG: adenylate/guanylate cyclase domain-containing protein [Verrucomicrobia bacterium]|nr:adenylate/guanylate cyclase domain-containing protein [Verrucomicrobiota bacterium]